MNLSERIEPRESRPGYYPFDGSGLTDANHRISMHVEDGGRGRDETLPKLEGGGGYADVVVGRILPESRAFVGTTRIGLFFCRDPLWPPM